MQSNSLGPCNVCIPIVILIYYCTINIYYVLVTYDSDNSIFEYTESIFTIHTHLRVCCDAYYIVCIDSHLFLLLMLLHFIIYIYICILIEH